MDLDDRDIFNILLAIIMAIGMYYYEKNRHSASRAAEAATRAADAATPVGAIAAADCIKLTAIEVHKSTQETLQVILEANINGSVEAHTSTQETLQVILEAIAIDARSIATAATASETAAQVATLAHQAHDDARTTIRKICLNSSDAVKLAGITALDEVDNDIQKTLQAAAAIEAVAQTTIRESDEQQQQQQQHGGHLNRPPAEAQLLVFPEAFAEVDDNDDSDNNDDVE